MSKRNEVLREFGTKEFDEARLPADDRRMADEIVRLREALAAATRVRVLDESEDVPVRTLHDEAMKACDERRWADAVEGEAMALARAVRLNTSAATQHTLAKSVIGICTTIQGSIAALEVPRDR